MRHGLVRPGRLAYRNAERGSARTGIFAAQIAITIAGIALAGPTGGTSLVIAAAVNTAISLGYAAYQSSTAKDSRQEQQSLSDLHVQTSTLGQIIPQIIGEFGNIAGNVIWATDKEEHEHRETTSAGKGGGPTYTTVTKTYTVSMAIAFADTRLTGPVEFVQIFRNYTLVYDMDATASGTIAAFEMTTPGSDYAVGDTGGLGGGNNNAGYVITAVDGGGGVTDLTIADPGSGYHSGDVCPLHRGGTQEGEGNDAVITLTDAIVGSLPSNWTFYTGTAEQLPDPTIEAVEGVGNVPGYRYLCYLVVADEDLGRGGVTPSYTATLRQQGSNELVDVLPLLLAPCGLTSGDMDLSEVEPAGMQTTVSAALVARQQVRALLEHLAQAYRFYVIESGTQLIFRQLETGDRFFQIPEADTDAAEERSPGKGVLVTRMDEIALPTELDVAYIDKEQNYQSNTQRAQRTLAVDALNAPQSLSFPLVLESGTAKVDACELLYNAWIGRESLRTTLGRKWAFLEPGDRGYITVRGVPYGVTLSEVTYGRPGLVEIVGQATASVCAPFVRGLPVPPPGLTPQPTLSPLMPPGDTTAFLLNLPALHASDSAPRYHVGYLGDDTPWPGAVLARSLDAGASYTQVDASALEVITGTVTGTVDDADYHVLDTVTSIVVVLEHGTLTSVSDLALYNGANVASIGDEVLAFGVATLTAPLTYTLTRLLRGRKGTEWAVGDHGVGERFFLLDAGVRAVAMSFADRHVERLYKSVTAGQSIADVTPQTFTPTAANVNPYSVAQPAAEQSGADFLITWRYRSRFGGEWTDMTGIAWDVDANGFQINIYTDNTYTTLVRTILTDGGNPFDPEAVKAYTYDAATQTLDFGSPQSSVYLRIYSLTNAGISVADDLVGV